MTPEQSIFESYIREMKKLCENSLAAFADKEMSGFQKLSIYRFHLSVFSQTSKKMLDEFNASLTLEERIKFDSAESAFSEERMN